MWSPGSGTRPGFALGAMDEFGHHAVTGKMHYVQGDLALTWKERLMLSRMKAALRSGNVLTGVIAVLALLVLFLSIFRDPNGAIYQFRNPLRSHLAGYDFSSAADAYKSDLQMQSRADLPAMVELERQLRSYELKEKLETLEIKREADFKRIDKQPLEGPGAAPKTHELKLLFVTFKSKGETKHKVESYEKHEGTGLWRPSFIDAYSVEQTDPALAKDMRDWEAQGSKK